MLRNKSLSVTLMRDAAIVVKRVVSSFQVCSQMSRLAKVPVHSRHALGGKDDSNIAPFLKTRIAACIHLLLNVMPSKRFQSHLILTLSWCLKNKIRSRWEKFALSYNPFFHVIQITIIATAKIVRNTTHFSPWSRGKVLSTM